MTSVVDHLPTSHGGDDDASDGADSHRGPYADEFVAEIRGLLAPTPGQENTPADPDPDDEDQDDATTPVLIFPERVTNPRAAEEAPAIHLFLPRPEPEVRHVPSLAGLQSPVDEDEHEPTSVPKLFVAPTVAPAEVAFVPAEEVAPDRYRWLLVLIGMFVVVGVIWLTWLAQSGETVDAPVTTVAATVAPTSSSTVTPATTTERVTTESPTTTESTVAADSTATTVVSSTPATAPRPTTPPRPTTTTGPTPTTTEALTIPEKTFSTPTVAAPTSSSTTAAPTTTASSTTAAPTTTASSTTVPTTAASSTTAAPTTTAAPSTTAATTTTPEPAGPQATRPSLTRPTTGD